MTTSGAALRNSRAIATIPFGEQQIGGQRRDHIPHPEEAIL
jgi:hypothetical protein